ncbi:ATP-dependent DNA helicase RecQ [Abditibacteriota bacterium]|nr:ATP-dependent DNA helicase RecQ [Abditibacteriota bacterium]
MLMNAPAQSELHEQLERVFGYNEFRPHQEEAIRVALEGRDVLVVMPTGAGKSLTFQLPAAIGEGTTIVISPLIALMRDQVYALLDRTAFDQLGVAFLNSSQDASEQSMVLSLLRAGKLKLLYVAPERLRSSGFVDVLRSIKVERLVVDEAHCISEWGHDFRPDYLAIGTVLDEIGRPPVMAVTATATTRVQESIAHNLEMRDPQIIVGGFNRPNLHFGVVRCKNELERSNKLFAALPKLLGRGGSGLIYASTRKQCEAVADLAAQALGQHGIKVGIYHAGMEGNARTAMQNAWITGQIPLLVATNAFGMGVDKADVRFVIHWGFPESPEAYYQEAGRAGRDGRRARATILACTVADRKLREFFIENDAVTGDDVREAFLRLAQQSKGEALRVPRGWWDGEFGWREPKPRVVLGKLERAGLIERINESLDGTLLRTLERSLSATKGRELERALERERIERFARLDEMSAYTKAKRCRRRILLDYFGDVELDGDEEAHANCCDVCDARRNGSDLLEVVAPTLANGKVPMPRQIGDIYDLLQGLDALWPQVGKSRLTRILRGSRARDAERYVNNPIFGVCASVQVNRLGDFLDELVGRGLVYQGDEEEFFVMRVTQTGRDAWQGRTSVDLELPGRARASSGSSRSPRAQTGDVEADFSDEEDGPVFERLRAWRRERADEERVPPYCVFSDKVLREIARQKPTDEDELAGINGVGIKKIEKYGDAVLEVVGAE